MILKRCSSNSGAPHLLAFVERPRALKALPKSTGIGIKTGKLSRGTGRGVLTWLSHRLVILLSVILLSVVCGPQALGQEAATQEVRFNRDIRQLLSDRCFSCHGPDAATLASDLRLDLREVSVDERGVIVPGDPDSSEMIRRILSDDPDEVMPPPELHKPIAPHELDLLRRWIQQGAVYEPHWAYVPPRWPADVPPQSVGSTSELIDQLISRRLREEGVQPMPPADSITLIRRLSIDLTGLPPTSEEVKTFLDDRRPDAYERLVDRLLASPRFGERMAIYWLDLVRYADTVGYHGDQNVSQSPYRDYVIAAFNDNMPYDQFIREQLAGDLLPNASLSQQVASGYNRLNQTTEEGGSQAKEYLAIYFADRVRNASQVFMGSTMGCAQCHDHKYDPFTTRDFYAFGAFFADLEEVGVYGNRGRPPMIPVPDQETQERLASIDEETAKLERQLAELRSDLLPGQAAWEVEARARLANREITEFPWVNDDMGLVGKDKQDAAWVWVNAEQGPVHSGSVSRRQTSDGLVQHLFLGVDTQHVVSESAKYFAWVYLDPTNPPSAIMLQFNDGSWEHRKVWGSDDIVYGRVAENRPSYQRAGALPATGAWVRLEVDANEVGLKPGTPLKGMAFTQFGGVAYWDNAGLLEGQAYPQAIADALNIKAEQRTDAQAATVTEFYLEQTEAFKTRRATIQRLAQEREKRLAETPKTVVSKSVTPRPIRILPRGNWMDDSGPVVEPAIPQFMGQLESDQRLTRLDLANWLTQPDHPLTARTMVNRLWSLMFGRGLCSSVDDFGGQGTYPSYPELLDALSLDFVQSGWDIKRQLRQIVLSQTYQRRSDWSPELKQRDPYNDLFARQDRFGLLAESVRDTALAISGLLVEQVGGPSVHPYQPAGYYAQLNFPRREYKADTDQNQFRRGVYTHWQRTFLHPMLKAFDAPSREECTAQRSRSNTPLQALTLLNDPTFVEAARGLAVRMMQHDAAAPADRVRWAYQEAVSRPPTAEMERILVDVYERHREEFRQDPAAAQELTSVGVAPKPEDLDVVELAAWTNVARIILNLHEVITRY